MEIYRTLVHPTPLATKISYDSSVMFLGSCFTESIGACFKQHKFNVDINPFGVLYNPFSVAESIKKMVHAPLYVDSDLVFEQEQWHSFDHHSSFSHAEKSSALTQINERLSQSHESLQSLSHLVITFGSSFYFVHKENDKVVSNCHKFSAKLFERKELQVAEIVEVMSEAIALLKTQNPGLQIIFTVSPIRYVQQGFVENTFAKAKLFNAIETLLKSHHNCHYFPAYELLIDDLRDYRFYKEDMLHPNDTAIKYIWSRVLESMIDGQCMKTLHEIEGIMKDVAHRPYQAKSEAHQRFLEQVLKKIEQVNKVFPHINFAGEVAEIKAQQGL